MTQLQSLHSSKMLADCRMRDIRRRVDVIQKKLADLQEMGVPSAFCYSSVRNTGSIFTLGDNRITDVIERHRNEILFNLMDGNGNSHDPDTAASSSKELHLILPVLPAPVEDLNRATLQSMIVGILKDLGVRWSDSKPVWWPADIPFVPPRSVPENFTGNWIQALKDILKSVYSHFSYDINSYIASKLESSHSDRETGHPMLPLQREQESPDDHCELDDADDEEESDYSEMEEDYFEDEENDAYTSGNHVQNTTHNNIISPTAAAAQYNSTTAALPLKPPPPSSNNNKHISSFTVENILMGKQNSPSSNSASINHSPPVNSIATTGMATIPTSGSVSSSIVGVNWVSHPPVKYTKFTILSPTAMSDEAQKKKKPLYDRNICGPKISDTVSSANEDTAIRHSLKKPLNSQGSCDLRTSTADFRPSTSSLLQAYSHPSSLAVSSATKDHSVAIPLTTSARLAPLPAVTSRPVSSSSHERKAVLTKNFPPPQKYVLLVPSSSVVTSSGLHSGIQSSSVASKTKFEQSVGNAVASRSSMSYQSPIVTPASSERTNPSSRLDKLGFNHTNSDSNNFRPIAPKKNAFSTSASKDSYSDRSKVHKRSINKPHKLRFHMTTVVTKQTRMPMKSSMTVESPSAAVSNLKNTEISPSSRDRMTDSGGHMTGRDPSVVESTITFSPNVFSSNTPKRAEADEVSEVESQSSSAGKKGKSREVHSQRDASIQTSSHNLGSSNYKATSVKLHGVGVEVHRCASENSMPVEYTSAASVHHTHGAGGRATRSYTRRKRELTFHLYEEPGTTFKPKKACKE